VTIRRPTVCMVVHGPYPLGQPPRVVREVAAARSAGYDVEVIATRRRGEKRVEVVDGVRVHRLRVTHRRGLGVASMALEYIGFTVLATSSVAKRSLRRPFAVVQIHNPPDFLVFAALPARLRGSRIVLDIHDLAPDMFAMRFGERAGASLAALALRKVERLACAFADAVITVHEPYKRELASRGVPPDKVFVVMNSIDDAAIPPATGGVEKEASGPRFVYHGTLTPHYGLEIVVRAFGRLLKTMPNAELEIYGEGDAVPMLRREIDRLGIARNVRLTDSFLPHAVVLERIRGASAGLIPNLPIGLNRFALSTKLFEYCALHISTIVSDLPTMREHFGDREVRFFRAGDEDALLEALADVASHPEDAGKRADAAAVRLQQYRWSISRDRYCALLKQLTDDRAAHSSGGVPVTADGPEDV
jgi:glycosyltransferase involved in cell wall biosynthesis